MMQDFDRTLELVDISTNSYGATLAQQAEYMGGFEAAMNGLTNSYEGLITALTDSDVIIGVVNVLTKIVEAVTWVVEQPYLLFPLLVLLISYGAQILNNKILEFQYNQAALKVQNRETIEKNKQLIIDKKQERMEKQVQLAKLKSLKVEQKQTTEKAKQNLLQAKINLKEAQSSKDVAAIAAATEEVKAAELEVTEAKAASAQTDKDIATTQAEIKLLNAEENSLQQEINEATLEGSNIFTNMLSTLGAVPNLLLTILGLHKAISAEGGIQVALEKLKAKFKKKTNAETKKQQAEEAVVTAAEGAQTVMESGQAGAKTGGLPGLIAGLAIGAAVVAALIGTYFAIKGIASYKEKKEQESINGNIKAMEKLNAEMYNLGQQVQTVQKIGDEFESLSSKINKSAEDLQRLEELITEFNDSVGFEMIAQGTDADTALTIMRGQEAILKQQQANLINTMQDTLNQAVHSGADLSKYIQTSGGRAVIQQLLSYQYEDFGSATDLTKKMIMDSISNTTDNTFVDNAGDLDWTKVKDVFGTDIIDALDEAVQSGSFEQYAAALDKVSNKTLEYIKASNTAFGSFAKISEKDLRKTIGKNIDALGLSEEALASFSDAINADIAKGASGVLAKDLSGVSSMDALLKVAKNYQNSINTNALRSQLATNEKAEETWLGETIKLDGEKKTRAEHIDWFVENQDNLSEDQQAQYKTLVSERGQFETEQAEIQDQINFAEKSMRELVNESGLLKTRADMQDRITKAQSTMDQLSKAAAGELDVKEMDELLDTYPEAVDALADGVISATELTELRNAKYKEVADGLQNDLQSVIDANTEIAAEEGWSWDAISKMTSIEDVEDYIAQNNLQDFGDKIKSSWRDYMATKMKVEDFTERGFLSEEQWEKVGKNNGRALAEAQYNEFKKTAELYSIDEADYVVNTEKAIEQAMIASNKARTEKAEAEQKLKEQLEGYEFTVIDGQLFYVEDGQIMDLKSLEGKDGYQDVLSAFTKEGLDKLVEAYTEADEAMLSNAQNVSDAYIDIKTNEVEKEKELIEKRKENYEEYFESLDALQEEQDRTQSKEDVIKQLSALSGGIDGASKSKMKDLQKQLQDLEKEESEARKEAAREAVLESLDDKTEKLDASMEELNTTMKGFIRALVLGDFTIQYGEDGMAALKRYLEESGKGFVSGGLVDYTGLAMVHGTSARPESFLSADDTELLAAVLEGLHLSFGNREEDNDVESSEDFDIVIENITISTAQLNNNQDFAEAGNTLAREFAKIIQERGLNVNVKK